MLQIKETGSKFKAPWWNVQQKTKPAGTTRKQQNKNLQTLNIFEKCFIFLITKLKPCFCFFSGCSTRTMWRLQTRARDSASATSPRATMACILAAQKTSLAWWTVALTTCLMFQVWGDSGFKALSHIFL